MQPANHQGRHALLQQLTAMQRPRLIACYHQEYISKLQNWTLETSGRLVWEARTKLRFTLNLLSAALQVGGGVDALRDPENDGLMGVPGGLIRKFLVCPQRTPALQRRSPAGSGRLISATQASQPFRVLVH